MLDITVSNNLNDRDMAYLCNQLMEMGLEIGLGPNGVFVHREDVKVKRIGTECPRAICTYCGSANLYVSLECRKCGASL